MGGLRVASRTSAFFFKGKPADAREIGAKLHVAFVVEGSVRKQGEQLRVTAQLIPTDDGYHVWSGSFERQLSDVFLLQQELAGSLVTSIQVKLTAQTRRMKQTHAASATAFDLYLQGKHVLHSFAPDAGQRGPTPNADVQSRSGSFPRIDQFFRLQQHQKTPRPRNPYFEGRVC
jgi:serine/threonine-protein kinase